MAGACRSTGCRRANGGPSSAVRSARRSSRRPWSPQSMSPAGGTSSATTAPRTWSTRRFGNTSAPTCTSKARWWTMAGCGSTFPITGRSSPTCSSRSSGTSTRASGTTSRSRPARWPTPTRSRSGPWRSSRKNTGTWCGWSRWGMPPSSSAAAPTSGAPGQIGLFQFAAQGGVAAGVRRIEAVTGPEAYTMVEAMQGQMADAAAALKAQPDHLLRKLEQLIEERERLHARVNELLRGGAAAPAEGTILDIGGVSVTLGETAVEDREEVLALVDGFRRARSRCRPRALRHRGPRGGARGGDRRSGRRGRKAGDLADRIAAVSGGKGGGRPQFASASAGDLARSPWPERGHRRVVAAWLAGRRMDVAAWFAAARPRERPRPFARGRGTPARLPPPTPRSPATLAAAAAPRRARSSAQAA